MSDSAVVPEVSEQMAVRRDKRTDLLNAGKNPYAVSLGSLTPIRTIREEWPGLGNDVRTGNYVRTVGRVINVRNVGKISFAALQAGDGSRIQALIFRDEIGEEAHADFKRFVDRGDFILVVGTVGTSKTGELSIYASGLSIVSKALRPLPTQHNELSEETRARAPYLALILSDEHRENMMTRSRVISGIRSWLTSRDYLEAETPILQSLHGGAAARPFVTESNAMGQNLFLRIAPELFLKRAVVGGFERVFELNKNFRNEGMDSTHSPEFTMLEAYEAFADYNRMAELTQSLIRQAAKTAGREDISESAWEKISLYDSLSQATGVVLTPETPFSDVQKIAAHFGVEVNVPTTGKLIEELWEALVKPTLSVPTFVFDYPEDSSPLVAPHRAIPGAVEKWDLYMDGFEVATGYSELIDPVIQRERLVAQALLADRGDDEAMGVDEAFLQALEYGMPPTGGIGIGIDRLMMVLLNKNIRETVLFPLVR